MIDLELFKHPVISTSIVMAVVSMIALVGFELLLSQELQFVHGFSPLQAAMFIIPFMIAISLGGPLAGICLNKWGLRRVSSLGILVSALSLWGLLSLIFNRPLLAWSCMVFWALALRLPYWPQLLPLCHPSHLIRRVQQVPLREWPMNLALA